jgi:hypothetical protein
MKDFLYTYLIESNFLSILDLPDIAEDMRRILASEKEA